MLQIILKKSVMLLGIFFLSTLLAACGDESGSSTEKEGELTGSRVDLGKELFQQQCTQCHKTNQLGLSPYTIASLADVINSSMPLNNSGLCDAQCAMDIAVFISVDNPNFGKQEHQNQVSFGDIEEPKGKIDAAPVTINRLNNTQYNNTVRDLLGSSQKPASHFPEDNRGGAGQFDTIAGSHSVSLTHVEQYISATDNLVNEAIANKVISCGTSKGVDCARKVIDSFGMNAWRRPLTSSEREPLAKLYLTTVEKTGSDSDALMQLSKAIILSPNFLYRPEIDDNLSSDSPEYLNAYELASRLSYFIWSSMPDQLLFDAAANQTLLSEGELRKQVRRMLKDSKAVDAMVEGFFVQWLKTDAASAPSKQYFPDFQESIIALMRTETRLLLRELFEQNAPINDIVSADFTYLNETLSDHYGVVGIRGDQFVRYSWGGGEERRGILGQGSFLTATSHPVVTSPVKRGAWLLTNLICKEPPPPPQGVNTTIKQDPALSTRDQSELHRQAGTSCYSCHSLMDPLGFGLENFDSAGQWRSMDGAHMVDARGVLPDGVEFDGPLQLSKVLANTPRLPMCVIDHLMTYGLGRGMEAFKESVMGQEPSGYAAVFDVYQKTRANDHSIHSIIEEIVLSPTFRMRRGADSEIYHQ